MKCAASAGRGHSLASDGRTCTGCNLPCRDSAVQPPPPVELVVGHSREGCARWPGFDTVCRWRTVPVGERRAMRFKVWGGGRMRFRVRYGRRECDADRSCQASSKAFLKPSALAGFVWSAVPAWSSTGIAAVPFAHGNCNGGDHGVQYYRLKFLIRIRGSFEAAKSITSCACWPCAVVATSSVD